MIIKIIKFGIVILFNVFIFINKTHADPVKIRELPYPHNHIITFGSDIDMQYPWWGVAFHSLINEQLGLPISDSMWVYGGPIPTDESYLLNLEEPNRVVSKNLNEPIFYTLIQQWHRGNIDHFHSWQNDNYFRIINDYTHNAIKVSDSTKISLSEVPSAIKSSKYRIIRFYFNQTPPENLSIILEDNNNQKVIISPRSIEKAKNSFPNESDFSNRGHGIDLVIYPGFDEHMIFSDDKFNLVNLKTIQFKAPNDEGNGKFELLKIERDNFSRQLVLKQKDYLKKFKIFPSYLSSHGGFTGAQNLGMRSESVERKNGTIWADPQIDNIVEPGAHNLSSHAYHLDILYDLGLKAFFAINVDSNTKQTVGLHNYHEYHESLNLQNFLKEKIYAITRTRCLNIDTNSQESFLKSYYTIEPGLKKHDIAIMYQGPNQWSNADQGSSVGLLILLGLERINQGKKVDNFWYTHFGTIPYAFQDEILFKKPVTENIEKYFRKLSNYYYNFDNSILPEQRVWVPSTSTYMQYKITKNELSNHILIDDKDNINIKRWTSLVTKRKIPNLYSPTQDLHGITIYVRDPDKTTVKLDGDSIYTFTKNPKDKSGKNSITIVDDSAATMLLGKIPLLSTNNDIQSKDFNLSDETDTHGERILTKMEAKNDGEVYIKYHPQHLNIWNISHLHFNIRKNYLKNSNAQFFITLIMEDNQKVLISESNNNCSKLNIDTDAFWCIKKTYSNNNEYHTLALDQLIWNRDLKSVIAVNGKRPPLPIGKIKTIQIGLLNATKGDQLLVGNIMALRPNNVYDTETNTKLLMGRVFKNNHGLAYVPVIMKSHRGTFKTITDKDGIYAFYDIPQGDVIQVYAEMNGVAYKPQQGHFIEMSRNEAEANIFLYDS